MHAAPVIAATRPTTLPRASRRYPAGRVCSAPGCQTVLSAYNQAGTCYLHSPKKAPRLRGHKPAPSQAA